MIQPTKHLNIRPFEEADVPCLKKWFYSGDYPEFFRDMLALTDAQLKIYSYMKDGQGFMIWSRSENPEPVGFIVLYEMRVVPANIKLSILIDKKYQEQGFALEAMLEMGRYIFYRLNMEKLIVEVLETNTRIQELLLHGGLECEATFKNEAKLKDKYINVLKYVLYKEQFKEIEVKFGG